MAEHTDFGIELQFNLSVEKGFGGSKSLGTISVSKYWFVKLERRKHSQNKLCESRFSTALTTIPFFFFFLFFFLSSPLFFSQQAAEKRSQKRVDPWSLHFLTNHRAEGRVSVGAWVLIPFFSFSDEGPKAAGDLWLFPKVLWGRRKRYGAAGGSRVLWPRK